MTPEMAENSLYLIITLLVLGAPLTLGSFVMEVWMKRKSRLSKIDL